MSHCYACDKLLSDMEAKRKHKKTKEEIGLCDACLSTVLEIQYIPIDDNESANDDNELEIDELIFGFSFLEEGRDD